MKIALLFSGQPRFIDTAAPYITSNLIEGYDVDVFAHLWYDEGLTSVPFNKWRTSEPGWHDKVIPENAIDNFVNTYNPVDIAVEESRRFNSPDVKIDIQKYWAGGIGTPDFEKITINNSMSKFYSNLSVNLLKKKYEHAHGFKYDWVVSCRTDTIVKTKIPYERFDSNLIHYSNVLNQPDGMICEWLNFGSSKNMDCFMSIYNSYERLVEITEVVTGAWCNELLHKLSLDVFGIKYQDHQIHLDIPRF